MSDRAAVPSRSETAAFAWFFGLAAALIVTALVIYWFVPPHIRRNLSREHGVIEAPTAVFFLAAAAVGAARLRGARADLRDARWLIPGLSLVAMLDEVNWIVFPLGMRRPTVFGHRVDGLHDLLEMFVAWLRHEAPAWSVLVVGVAAAGAVGWAARQAAGTWPRVKESAPWRFFALALLLAVLAQMFDVFASQRNRLATLCEEVLELDAALALLFAAWQLPHPPPR
jgi:hypothetical protein